MVQHLSKSVDYVLNATHIGVDIVDGIHLVAQRPKLMLLLCSILHVVHNTQLSPWGMQALLGHSELFDLFNGP